MHTNSKLFFERHVLPLIQTGMKVLEIGPDSFPSTFRQISKGVLVSTWDTLDIRADSRLTYGGSAEYSFNVQSELYDIVISGNVIEHVKKPWLWLPELVRVTRPGGLVVTISPVSFPFHEAPVDCWRIYPEGMRSLYEDSGLVTVTSLWGSLELPGYRRYIPGTSIELQSRSKKLMYKTLGWFGLPVERAYDQVTIGRKQL